MKRAARFAAVAVLTFALAPAASAREASAQAQGAFDPDGIERLIADTGSDTQVSLHPATGGASFVRLPSQTPLSAASARRAAAAGDEEERSAGFLRTYGGVFGIRQVDEELETIDRVKDQLGGTHIRYRQVYRGVPVFGAELKSHFDSAARLTAINGTFIPDLAIDPNPTRSAEEAKRTALAIVAVDLEQASRDVALALTAREPKLLVFREGLAQGVPGANRLAWEVEVADGAWVREFVYVDAHTGKFIDQITGTPDSLYRRAYDGAHLPYVPPSYPADPYWVEGDPFPTASTEADNMLLTSKEVHDLFLTTFGFESFDGKGAVMDAIFDRGYGCPNASWNGNFISFCPGFTTDDITTHEWAHAYTEYTHGLIYQWQPGALNEAYSDIWGEVVDLLNGRGSDIPNEPRSANACTSFTPPRGLLQIDGPAGIAGVYTAQSAAFGPVLTPNGVSAEVVAALDVGASATDACSPLTNAAEVAGRIALVDRGTCPFVVKVLNAQAAGAVGVIVANNAATGLPGMGGASPAVTIPSLGITRNDGELVRAHLPGVQATLRSSAGTTDYSYRWLEGEDVIGGGAIRDMWNPTCYANPAKVSDVAYYHCATTDSGGVHTNSGVPNHAFALLVDGGSYNGYTVGAIGLTKAAHIYFRAQRLYQSRATSFAEHADALEQSCADLVGVDLASLTTGLPSGEIIRASDCVQVASAMLAVEMRDPPVQCGFQPILAKNPPNRCGPNEKQVTAFFEDFEPQTCDDDDDCDDDERSRRWTVSHDAVTADFTPRDWELTSSLPGDRRGAAFFGVNFPDGTCAPGGDESGVLHLDSPHIKLSRYAAAPLLTFDHWLATEADWDGGNVKVSVNGGPWTLVALPSFTFNPYNGIMRPAPGNTNPLAGEPAFTGTDQGAVFGSWGRSHVDLGAYARPGDRVRLRFDLGSDGCAGIVGWYVDDVTVYRCVPRHQDDD